MGGTPYVFMMIISLLRWFILVDSENTSWAFRVSRQENVQEKIFFFLPNLKLVTQQSPLCFELLWCGSIDTANISGKFIFNGSQRPLWLSSSCCSNHLDRPLLTNVELITRNRAQLCPLLLSFHEWLYSLSSLSLFSILTHKRKWFYFGILSSPDLSSLVSTDLLC